jgi:hypothetical protein
VLGGLDRDSATTLLDRSAPDAVALAGGQRADRAPWHRAMATDTADEDIAGRLEASARDSQRCGGHASAASALERAAELSESETARGSRLAMAAVAAWLAGQAERARGLIDRSVPAARGTQLGRHGNEQPGRGRAAVSQHTNNRIPPPQGVRQTRHRVALGSFRRRPWRACGRVIRTRPRPRLTRGFAAGFECTVRPA